MHTFHERVRFNVIRRIRHTMEHLVDVPHGFDQNIHEFLRLAGVWLPF